MSADHSDVIQIQKRLKSASAELNNPAMIALYAQAVTVNRYDRNRQKGVISKYVIKYLKDGCSAVEAEHRARADEACRAELEAQAEELQTAIGVISKREDGVKTSWETARSLLSFQREGFKHMPETEDTMRI